MLAGVAADVRSVVQGEGQETRVEGKGETSWPTWSSFNQPSDQLETPSLYRISEIRKNNQQKAVERTADEAEEEWTINLGMDGLQNHDQYLDGSLRHQLETMDVKWTNGLDDDFTSTVKQLNLGSPFHADNKENDNALVFRRPAQLAPERVMVDLFSTAPSTPASAKPVHREEKDRLSLQQMFIPPVQNDAINLQTSNHSPSPERREYPTAMSERELFSLDLVKSSSKKETTKNEKLDFLLSTISSFNPPLTDVAPNTKEETEALREENIYMAKTMDNLDHDSLTTDFQMDPGLHHLGITHQFEREHTSPDVSLFQVHLKEDADEKHRLAELRNVIEETSATLKQNDSHRISISQAAEAERDERMKPVNIGDHENSIACQPKPHMKTVEMYAQPGWKEVRRLNLARHDLHCVDNLRSLAPRASVIILDENQVVYLDGIGAQVDMISLRSNKLSNMTSFQHLVHLRELDISGNTLSDVSSLQHLDSLVSLRAAGNQLQDIHVLFELPNLQFADLSFNRIREIAVADYVLAACPIRSLDLRGNSIISISMIPARLEELNVSRNNLNTEAIQTWTSNKLTKLDASHNQIEHFDTIRFPSLRVLNIERNLLVELIIAPGLERLDVHGQLSHGMGLILRESDFPAMMNLSFIDLSASNLVSLFPLVHLQALTELDLNSLGLVEIPENLPSTIRRLSISCNRISDPDPLLFLPRLVDLDMRNNVFSDISVLLSVLSKCHLDRLDLRNNIIPETQTNHERNSDSQVVKHLCYRSLFIYSLKSLTVFDGSFVSPLDRKLSKTYLLKVKRYRGFIQ